MRIRAVKGARAGTQLNDSKGKRELSAGFRISVWKLFMKRFSFSKVTLIATIAIAARMPVTAATIDTFDFSQPGYTDDTGAPGILSGSFTGTVEASGFIENADLSSFTAQLTFSDGFTVMFPALRSLAPGGAPFFSYNVNGGASSLDFIATDEANTIACEGAAATLACGAPAGAFGIAPGFGQTDTQASISLVSSVTPVSSAPEPGTEALAGAGLIVLGMLRRARKAR